MEDILLVCMSICLLLFSIDRGIFPSMKSLAKPAYLVFGAVAYVAYYVCEMYVCVL